MILTKSGIQEWVSFHGGVGAQNNSGVRPCLQGGDPSRKRMCIAYY